MEPLRLRPRPALRPGYVLLAGALLGVFGAACSSDDDDDDDAAPAASATAATCAAYDDVVAANAALADVDIMTATPQEANDAVDAVLSSVTALSEATGVDDEDVIEDINAVLAEIPPGEDPETDQLALQALRDSRDIMVADVNAWLEKDVQLDCA
ncbi:MAG TPA: hypothetical protein VFT09_00495 [Ilumatobacteraceae bacterium]|nr:hypothetical protein [Ilumatobacteraceae bacterium]